MMTISEAAEKRVRKPKISPRPPKNSPMVTKIYAQKFIFK
jgi:hypothetical protein